MESAGAAQVELEVIDKVWVSVQTGLALAGALEQSGVALVSSTRLARARDPALRPEPDQRGSGCAPGP